MSRTTVSSDPMRQALEAQAIGLKERLLLVGEARELAEAAGATGAEVVCASAERATEQPAETFSQVFVRGALEHEAWDRWWLQRLHRTLRPAGRLVLDVPHLLDLSTLAGATGLLARASRQVAKRWTHATPPSLLPRRYTRQRLEAMLTQVRFQVDSIQPWRAAPWSSLGPGPDGFASRLCVTATKRAALFGPPPSNWPPEQRPRSYDRAGFAAVRDEWARAHGAAFERPVEEFEPQSYRGANILVLAPHPDDEIIGAGGTLLRLVAAGARVHGLHATDGSAGAALEGCAEDVRRRVRIDEARAVGAAAGFSRMTFWCEDNRAFRASEARIAELRALLAEERPRVIFVPFVTEAHADHLTLARMLAAAIPGAAGLPVETEVWCYEVWSLVPPNRWSTITQEMPQVAELLCLYDMAMRIDDFVHFCADRDCDHHRAWRGTDGYAEAFFALPAARFPELLASVGATA